MDSNGHQRVHTKCIAGDRPGDLLWAFLYLIPFDSMNLSCIHS